LSNKNTVYSGDIGEGARVMVPSTRNRLKKSCEKCCRQSLSVSTLAKITVSLIYHQWRQYSLSSSAGTQAPLIGPQSGCNAKYSRLGLQAYSRCGPRRITAQKKTLKRAGKFVKIHISRPIQNIFWGPKHLPQWGCSSPYMSPPHTPPHTLCACGVYF